MDAFSEILSGVKLNGALFFSAEFSAPWGFSVPASNVNAAKLSLDASHLVLYHFVIDGGAVVELRGRAVHRAKTRRCRHLSAWGSASYVQR